MEHTPEQCVAAFAVRQYSFLRRNAPQKGFPCLFLCYGSVAQKFKKCFVEMKFLMERRKLTRVCLFVSGWRQHPGPVPRDGTKRMSDVFFGVPGPAVFRGPRPGMRALTMQAQQCMKYLAELQSALVMRTGHFPFQTGSKHKCQQNRRFITEPEVRQCA